MRGTFIVRLVGTLGLLVGMSTALAQPTADDAADRCSQFAGQLVGLPFSPVVETFAQTQGLQVRVTAVDDQRFPVTMDYRHDRVNLIVKNGVITEAGCG